MSEGRGTPEAPPPPPPPVCQNPAGAQKTPGDANGARGPEGGHSQPGGGGGGMGGKGGWQRTVGPPRGLGTAPEAGMGSRGAQGALEWAESKAEALGKN